MVSNISLSRKFIDEEPMSDKLNERFQVLFYCGTAQGRFELFSL